ncbi:hypothetical protein ACFSJ3_03385 [Corallincola platygyrae]|uniref:Uncharacterized protein n=1 Tax=Corallincola platygyrae TaxID=1193278 RepID=A0ABW4XIZ8_9GAMM
MNKVSTGKCCLCVPPGELAKGSEQRLVGAPWVVRVLGEQDPNKGADAEAYLYLRQRKHTYLCSLD